MIMAMKKTGSSARASSAKGGATTKTVEGYLAAVPEPAHSTLEKVRATIRSVVPAEAEEVISYGMPAFRHKKVIVWYAAFSDHCSLFPTASVMAKLKDELKGYAVAKGTIHFPSNKPLPAALLQKIVKTRLAEIQQKT